MITLPVQRLQLSINGNCYEMEEINRSDTDGGGSQQPRNEEGQEFLRKPNAVMLSNV